MNIFFRRKQTSTLKEPCNIADVSVILNVWKRNYISEQLESIFNQTLVPKEVWIIQYENNISIIKLLKKYPDIKWLKSSNNLKYFGRFSFVTYIKTQYTWVLDDDIIPSSTWLETCIKTSQLYNSIVCSNGVILGDCADHTHIDFKAQLIGIAKYPQPYNYCPVDTYVDYGNSSYFFRTEWIKLFWSIWPTTLETGEDIHLSAACNIQANIPTVIPSQLNKATSGNIKPSYSSDEHASWMKPGFLEDRREVIRYFINQKAWSLVKIN